jgi:5'-nucleotidase
MVRGTPTDCVLFAYEKVMGRRVDLVLSGVNRGANLAEDITHSGTVAGALEGTLCGVPSIAMSQEFSMWEEMPLVQWDLPREWGAGVVREIMRIGIPQGLMMNVNFPDCGPAECRGIRMAPTGRRQHGKQLDERLDRRGRPYYWIHWGENDAKDVLHPASDLACMREKFISLTPINLDLTDYPVLELMREQLEGTHAFDEARTAS